MTVQMLGIGLQFSALTLIAVLIILALRDLRSHISTRYLVLSLVATSALFLQLPGMPEPILFVLRMIDTLIIGFLWWCILSLIEEDFKLRALHWIGFGLSVACFLPFRLGWPSWGGVIGPEGGLQFYILDIVTLILCGHLAWKLLSDFGDDLIDARRRLRLIVLASIIVAILLARIGENFLALTGSEQNDIAYIASVAIPVLFTIILWAARLRWEVFAFQPISQSAPAPSDIRPEDRALHKHLMAEIDAERVWAEPGLTIGALADKLGVPEHKLRALINKGLGYRNFAAFLNTYRLAYAKSVLADTEQARLPILTIAMDAGFGSLAPFNRAFKDAEGITPSQYRAKALTDQN